jgi:hypothetical protein
LSVRNDLGPLAEEYDPKKAKRQLEIFRKLFRTSRSSTRPTG